MRTALLALTIFVLLVLLAYQSLIAWDVRMLRKFAFASLSLHQSAAALACVPKTAILEAADERNWEIEEGAQITFRSSPPDTYAEAVRIHVQPPLNFSKEPGVMFYFDSQGCYISKY